MFEREVLIVDDNISVKDMEIPIYKELLKSKRIKDDTIDYQFNFTYAKSVEEAKEAIDATKIIDIMVIDYDFDNVNSKKNGIDLIKYIRSEINKLCKIIFYTIHGVSEIPSEEIVSLVNNDIYKFIDKAKITDEEFVDLLYEAAVECNPIITSFERFWESYESLFENAKYSFMGEQNDFKDLITHLRMMDDIGKNIVNKLLYKAILGSTEVQGD